MNYDGLTCFEQLMLLKVLQPESVIHAIHGFVAEVLDTSLLEIQPQPILKAMEELQEKDGKFRALLVCCDDSRSQCPSINEELKVLVEQRRATKDCRRAHVSRCSPLQDIQHVREAALEGAFVLITELQLASKDFLADLEMLMEELCLGATKEGAAAHRGAVLGPQGESATLGHSHHGPGMFRLVLCTTSGLMPPLGVVEMCQKVAMFPPIGVKGRLRQLAMGSNAWERLKVEEPEDLTPWYQTLFSLCLFHAVLGERYHRYQCCFQSTAYDIAAHWSFKCAVQFFAQETHSQELISHPPWEAMMHWIRTKTHGGHLGDPWHRQRLFALIERFLGPSSESLRNALRDECFEDDEEMSELQLQRARSLRQYLDFHLPHDESHPLLGKEAAARCVEALPPAPAELFGLHAREVLERIEEEEDVQDRPATGLYCVGIFLYGAGWDRRKSIMADCRPDELFYRMPVIHFIPTADFKPNLEKTYAVPFYQAERQSHMTTDGEDGNYITEVLLRSHKSPKQWLLRSVALYCELML
ncbi:unnamed protein product [Cladocopium goreaui]|uniref:DYH8 protein n=1 Tax=Cladocopium goreaui TaxID=2562237 RepID=A0A9P1BTK0_9DINO|nr:unnamed protein product [Cladocopium goreaui]